MSCKGSLLYCCIPCLGDPPHALTAPASARRDDATTPLRFTKLFILFQDSHGSQKKIVPSCSHAMAAGKAKV